METTPYQQAYQKSRTLLGPASGNCEWISQLDAAASTILTGRCHRDDGYYASEFRASDSGCSICVQCSFHPQGQL